MYKLLIFIMALIVNLSAQNAAVSSYLNPVISGNADVRIREVRMPSYGHSIGTYWCTLGYWTTGSTHGYGGLQWTPDNSVGPKNYIYSQWNDYSTAAYNDPATQVTTFGGEGTGVKSINNDPLNQWETDYWHVTADRVWNEGSNTHFAYIVKNGKTGVWRHLMTWNTPESNLKFTGSYCFMEDWRGDGEYRESQIRKGWNRLSSNSSWTPIITYNYDINDGDIAVGGRSYNKRTNWSGGKKSDATGEFFYMGAGGDVGCTNNDNTNYTIARTETSPQEEYGVHKISKLNAIMFDSNNKLSVLWSWDSTTVPQFIYTITVKDNGNTVLTKTDTIPQRRGDTLDISSLSPDTKLYTITLNVVDFFDGQADPATATFGNGAAGYILISNPKGGETYNPGDEIDVQWQSDITSDDCKVSLLHGNSTELLGTVDITSETLTVEIPTDIAGGSDYKIVVAAVNADTVSDTSSAFTIFVPDSTNLKLDNSHISSITTTSEQSGYGIENAFDRDSSTYWHTQYSPTTDNHPHIIVVQLDTIWGLKGFYYLPRQDGGANGTIKEYEIAVSRDSVNWETVVDSAFSSGTAADSITFDSVKGVKYIRITAISEINGGAWASAAEFEFRYDATWIDSGTPILGSAKLAVKNKLSIKQNGKVLQVKVDNSKSLGSFRIFSINGRLLFNKTKIESNTFELDLNHIQISQGMYIFRINKKNKVFYLQ